MYLRNSLNNLLKNSLHFIKEAQKGEIFISIDKNKEFNIIRFKDTAKGVSQATIDHMFDGFFSTRIGGTGLGLAFCRNIMLSFNGDITVDSVVGEYIEFSLKFPQEVEASK
jgi:signal transduction histidine kinase